MMKDITVKVYGDKWGGVKPQSTTVCMEVKPSDFDGEDYSMEFKRKIAAEVDRVILK